MAIIARVEITTFCRRFAWDFRSTCVKTPINTSAYSRLRLKTDLNVKLPSFLVVDSWWLTPAASHFTFKSAILNRNRIKTLNHQLILLISCSQFNIEVMLYWGYVYITTRNLYTRFRIKFYAVTMENVVIL